MSELKEKISHISNAIYGMYMEAARIPPNPKRDRNILGGIALSAITFEFTEILFKSDIKPEVKTSFVFGAIIGSTGRLALKTLVKAGNEIISDIKIRQTEIKQE